jgi:bacteriocin biosynthesis cyclodehydratase domain-containing protein
MRPQLVRDSLFATGDDLVRVYSNRGDFVLRGKHVAGWLDQLAPYLDGRRSLEALTAGLPTAQHKDVQKLVAMLVEQRVVQDLDLELPHGLTQEELIGAGSEIAYIDSCVGSGAHHFERFRDTSLLVFGPDAIAMAIAERVRALGCRRVDVAGSDTDLCEPAPSRLPLLVIACSEHPSRLIAVNRACRNSGKALLPIALAGEVAWIGPLVRPDKPGCWECAGKRLAEEGFSDGTWPTAPISTALLAGRAAFEAFRVLTDPSQAEGENRLVRLDLETGFGEPHPFHPHPLCEACRASVARDEASLEDRWSVSSSKADVSAADVERSADDLVDPYCGILRELGDGSLPQLPYRATRAVISNPTPNSNPVVVVATAETLAESRARAVQRALASYGQALCEHRLASSDEPTGVRAWDLVGDAPARIPRGANLVSRAGISWTEALASALFEHSVRLLDANSERLGSVPEIDIEAAGLDDAYLTWTRRLAAAVGLSPRLLDLTGELGVPAVAAVVDGVCVAHATAAGRARAAALVMEAVISRWQIGGSDPEIRFEIGEMAGDKLWRALADRLLARGWRPLGLPLDEDRAVSIVCPHLVTVALVPFLPRQA